MATKYTTQSITGYNSSPPPDDGTTGDDNKLKWSNHKDKLADPIKTLAEAIDTALVAYVAVDTLSKSSNYTVLVTDDRKAIECTSSPTITLGAAASMGTGYIVTVKCVSGTTTVATSDTIDGSASNRSIAAGDSETYRVNSAADGYLLEGNTGIGAAQTVTLSNKTHTSPVINGTISGDAFLDEDTMSSDSATKVASQQSIKAYVSCIQKVEATPITARSTNSTLIPNDDTIPQQTGEGTEIITVTITPKLSTSRLVIDAHFPVCSHSETSTLIAALFLDSTEDAIAVSVAASTSSGEWTSLSLRHEMASPDTSSHTFKVKVGASAGSFYNNGGTGRKFGGISATTLSVTEYT